jgi:hypothetical protein
VRLLLDALDCGSLGSNNETHNSVGHANLKSTL